MSKTLKQFLEVYKPKSPDEQKFVDKHVTIKHKDRNGNGDDVFTASNIKTIKRKEERHGYDAGEDEKVYEEVEELDELSRTTLATYAIKAKNQMGRDEARAGYARGIRTMDGKGQGEMEKAHDKRAEKRSKGIDTALNKLAKEEVESVDEMAPPGAKYERMVKHIKKGYAKGGLTDRERAIAYATAWKAKKANEGVEYVVPTLEEQLIEKIDSLSESNQETMLAVFEQLSEDNKAKFVDYCETPEGVNAMLDFAIDNRGE